MKNLHLILPQSTLNFGKASCLFPFGFCGTKKKNAGEKKVEEGGRGNNLLKYIRRPRKYSRKVAFSRKWLDVSSDFHFPIEWRKISGCVTGLLYLLVEGDNFLLLRICSFSNERKLLPGFKIVKSIKIGLLLKSLTEREAYFLTLCADMWHVAGIAEISRLRLLVMKKTCGGTDFFY